MTADKFLATNLKCAINGTFRQLKNHIMYYPRGIKVTKLKYEYKVVDKNNSLTLYIPFSEVQEKM